MDRLKISTVLCCVMVLLAAKPDAGPQPSKLDAHLRITLDQLRAGASVARLRAEGAPLTAAGDLDVFIVGPASRGQLQAAGARVRTSLPGVATADLPTRAVNALVSLPGVRRVEAAVPVQPLLEISVPLIDADKQRGGSPDFSGLNGAGVLVGDVDTGVDFHHADFKNPDGSTRFVSIWDQTDTTGPGSPPPAPFNYGRECSSGSINAGTCNEFDVGEGHGSHVMGISGGDGSATPGGPPLYVGVAPKADLILVKIDFTSNAKIVDGVSYIMSRATSLGKNAVVNLSLGTHRGPHDGSSAFESMLNGLTGPGRIVVDAAGNDALMPVHAATVADGSGDGSVRMRIAGANVANVSVNGYYDAPADIDVYVQRPNGMGTTGPVHLGQMNAASPGECGSWGCVYVENGVTLTSNGSREVIITLQAAESPIAPPNGDWVFQFVPVDLAGTSGKVDLWRYHISGEPEAKFCSLAEVVSNCDLPFASTLVIEPANASNVITVAAWTSKPSWMACNGGTFAFPGTSSVGSLAPFSSPGPTRDGRQKPDIAAPGAVIASTLSMEIPPLCPPSSAAFTQLLADGPLHRINHGTSMAAPHVTGVAALLLQKYGAVTPAFIKNYLTTHAVADSFTGTVPNSRWGHGKLKVGDLANPTAQVLAPNGGQTLFIGSSTTLSWSATDLHPEIYGGVTSVDLLLSRDGMNGTYTVLFTGIPNNGSKPWIVTGPATAGFTAFLKVVAHDVAGNAGSDVSNTGFKIKQPLCTVCQGSYCSDAGERCTAVSACMSGSCCQYTCGPDPSCTAPDPCPDNACGCF